MSETDDDLFDPSEAPTKIPQEETDHEKLLRSAYIEQGKVIASLEHTNRDLVFRVLNLERDVTILKNENAAFRRVFRAIEEKKRKREEGQG